MRPAIGIDGGVGEYALSHFYLFCTQAAANPAFNFDSNRCVANTLDIAETADLITDHYRTMKFHTGNGDSNDSAASAPRRYRAARKVHLTKQPTAENVTMGLVSAGIAIARTAGSAFAADLSLSSGFASESAMPNISHISRLPVSVTFNLRFRGKADIRYPCPDVRLCAPMKPKTEFRNAWGLCQGCTIHPANHPITNP